MVKPFGENFREILRQRNLTQIEAAELLKTSQSVISGYCRLKTAPRTRILEWMSTRLGVSVPELKGEVPLAEPGKGIRAKIEEIQKSTYDDLASRAMDDLRQRWRKKPSERDTIKHLVAALFPKDAQRILAWLDKS